VFRGPWEDARRVDDVEFADRYLNPHDQPFDILTLKQAIQDAGLTFLNWFEPRDWDLERLLPKFATYAEVPQDPWDQFSLIEQLFDRPKLDLYLVGPRFEKRQTELEQDTYLGLNPQLFLNCLKARGVSFHRSAQLRLGPESPLTRDEGAVLEGIGLRFITARSLVKEMLNPKWGHWEPILRELLAKDFLFCPHPR
jgi:hypothetical protein